MKMAFSIISTIKTIKIPQNMGMKTSIAAAVYFIKYSILPDWSIYNTISLKHYFFPE